MSLVPIIIPAYRAPDKLERCLAAIKQQTYASTDVFVRDNTHDNIFFTAAVNEGLAKYCYRDDVRMVMILNQDAYLRPDALEHLVRHMNEHPNCGIACPLQISSEDNRVSWGGSLEAFPYGGHKRDPIESYLEPFETYWANGAAMLIRVDVVREVGVFDKNMKFIASDADFSFSARARGWKVTVVPQAVVDHTFSTSADVAIATVENMKNEDIAYFGEKWLSGGLYRAMSYEGHAFPPATVQRMVDKVRAALRKKTVPAS